MFAFHERTAGFADKDGSLASDTITDFTASGGGRDIIRFLAYEAGAQAIAVQDGANVLLSVDTDGNGTADIFVATVENTNVADVLGQVEFVA